MASGDVDGDGEVEIIWGGGHYNSGPDRVFVGGFSTGAIDWRSSDLEGPFFPHVGDVDADGDVEIVVTVARSDNGYSEGQHLIFDGHSRRLEYASEFLRTGHYYGKWASLLVQADSDPQLEICSATAEAHIPVIICYDGVTQDEDVRIEGPARHTIAAMKAGDLTGDGSTELILVTRGMTTTTSRMLVVVADLATGMIEWQLQPLASSVSGVVLADLDGDGVLEIAVAGYHGVFLVDGSTGLVKETLPVGPVHSLAAIDHDGDGDDDLVMGTGFGEILIRNSPGQTVVVGNARASSIDLIEEVWFGNAQYFAVSTGSSIEFLSRLDGEPVHLIDIALRADNTLVSGDSRGDGVPRILVGTQIGVRRTESVR